MHFVNNPSAALQSGNLRFSTKRCGKLNTLVPYGLDAHAQGSLTPGVGWMGPDSLSEREPRDRSRRRLAMTNVGRSGILRFGLPGLGWVFGLPG